MSVLAGAVCYIDSLLRAMGYVDCIVACASANNELKLRVCVHISCSDLSRSHDQHVGVQFA